MQNAYTSGITHIETRLYITDRNNEAREQITDAAFVIDPDWDIDRAGSKGQVDIEISRPVLETGMWLAPYLVLIPETGDIIEQQMGHFRIGMPGSLFDDSMSYTGERRQRQFAFGSDIVDDIASVRLSEPFYTPVGSNIMADVLNLIKLATVGQIGPNLLGNPGMENTIVSPWNISQSASGVGTVSPSTTIVAEGKQSAAFLFNSGRSANQWLRLRQAIDIPGDARFLLISGMAYMGVAAHRCQIDLEWMDESENVLGSMFTLNRGQFYQQWRRHLDVFEVPFGAMKLNVHLRVYTTATITGASTSRWDDVQVRAVTGMPVPDSRISLPQSSAVATTRIQSTVGDSIGYDAINAHRLNAISHHAIFAHLDGRMTSLLIRGTDNTPARTYRRQDIRDYRIIGEVELLAADGNVPNHFVAVKESFEEGVPSLYGHAYNNDLADPFSIPRTGRIVSADPSPVQDAVSEADLEAIAANARDRQTVQEEARIWVLPDPTLSVHNVVEIDDDTMPGLSGRWLVQYIRPGMRPDDPLVEVMLRRAVTGGL